MERDGVEISHTYVEHFLVREVLRTGRELNEEERGRLCEERINVAVLLVGEEAGNTSVEEVEFFIRCPGVLPHGASEEVSA